MRKGWALISQVGYPMDAGGVKNGMLSEARRASLIPFRREIHIGSPRDAALDLLVRFASRKNERFKQ